MSGLKVACTTLAGLACALTGASAASGAERVISLQAESSFVRAHRGHVVWSRPAARGGFELMHWHAGEVRRLPVPARRVPFDADIGPGPRGGFVVVYSRCRREPRERHHRTALPLFEQGRGCALFRHRLGARGERRLRRVSAPRGSEYLPAVWRDRIAFARRGRVFRSRTDGTGVEALRRGRSSGRGQIAAVPRAVELRGAAVAFEWEAMLARCPRGPWTDFPGELTQILVAAASGRGGVIARGCDTKQPSRVASPSLGPAGVSYAESARSVRLRTRGRRARRLDPETVSVQRDGRRVVTAVERPAAPAAERYRVAVVTSGRS